MSSFLLKGFQQGPLLSLKNKEYRLFVQRFLNLQLEEDLRKRDLTTSLLFSGINSKQTRLRGKAEIFAKQAGILAGVEEFKLFCGLVGISVKSSAEDGETIHSGDKILALSGLIPDLLKVERVGLDLLGRLSGIATATNELVQKIKKIAKTKISATRKTLWGNLDKKAVFIGGGLTHRLGLWQAVLIKENHLTALENLGISDPFLHSVKSISCQSAETLRFLRSHRQSERNGFPVFFEIEVETMGDAVHAGELVLSQNLKFPAALLLDNFSPREARKTVKIFSENGWQGKILLEASGGITPFNIQDYAETGVDLISIGFLTHSAKHFDFSQRIVKMG